MSASNDTERLMAKAERSLRSAGVLLDVADVDGACSRAYYAMFDAARAALLFSDESLTRTGLGKTHQGLMKLFNERLVKSGKLSRDFGRSFRRAEEIRIVADYGSDLVAPEDAVQIVERAEQFVQAVRAVLDGSGATDSEGDDLP